MKSQRPAILFVHQGCDLYGSDRTFIQSVESVVRRWPEARITVLLPSDGDLRPALLSIVDDVRIVDLAILRKANLKRLSLRDMRGLIKKILEARRMMRDYDVTYINTLVVMDYILAACLVRRPRIIHVHEIPTMVATLLFSAMLILSRAFVIFNSHATRQRFVLPPWQDYSVVRNGVAGPAALHAEVPHAKLNLLFIGRFNSWKGQTAVPRAIAKLPQEARAQVNVRMVGSVFGGQVHFRDELVRTIAEQGVSELVEMFPFTTDPYPHYFWADVVLVPSVKPEPFGIVAIEAMAAGRAVIAANHGGLREIVLNGVTGTLIEPCSVEALAAAIFSYIGDWKRLRAEGDAGRERFAAEFEESHYKLKITKVIADLCEPQLA
jgi:glycosyltransferase involved in cell wall biosynthesis